MCEPKSKSLCPKHYYELILLLLLKTKQEKDDVYIKDKEVIETIKNVSEQVEKNIFTSEQLSILIEITKHLVAHF